MRGPHQGRSLGVRRLAFNTINLLTPEYAFELFQESHDPPLDDLFAELPA